MTSRSFPNIRGRAPPLAMVTAPVTRALVLLGLCAAYMQGALAKIFGFDGAVSEMKPMGLAGAFIVVAAVDMSKGAGQ